MRLSPRDTAVSVFIVVLWPAWQASSSQVVTRQTLDHYSRTGLTGTLEYRTVSDFVKQLDDAAKAWIQAAAPLEQARRRNTAALFALDVAGALRSDTNDGLHILEWACAHLRRAKPSEFERSWMVASSMLFLRRDFEANFVIFGDPTRRVRNPNAITHLEHALSRYPAESRLLLARFLQRPEVYALASRPRTDPKKLVSVPSPSSRRLRADVARISTSLHQLEAIAGDSEAGAEARAHIGLLRFHLGDLTQAKADLRRAGSESSDPYVRNLAYLVLGLTLDAEDRESEATDAYRAAVDAMPRARASAVQLAVHLRGQGKHAEAAEAVRTAFGPSPLELEPWRHIVALDRLLPADLARLRLAVGLPDVSAGTTSAGTSSARKMEPAPHAETMKSQLPVFASRADAVTLDVLVDLQGRPVNGLSASDFLVFDNGVPQSVEAVQLADVPLDVSLVVDMFKEATVGTATLERSTPESRQWVITSSWTSPEVFSQIRHDIGGIDRILGTADALRLLQVDGGVGSEVWSFQRPPFPLDRLPPDPGARPSLASLRQDTYGRMQGLYDVTAASLLHAPIPSRRHVVVVFTDGVDGASVLPPARFLQTVRESSAVMFVMRRDTQAEIAADRGIKSANPYGHLYWHPDPNVIEEAARSTGGGLLFHPGGELLSDLTKVLDTFRRGYVIRYQPRTATPGWHSIQIRIANHDDYSVRVRTGYRVN